MESFRSSSESSPLVWMAATCFLTLSVRTSVGEDLGMPGIVR
ncbi:hypothetical protein K788_0001754 (plasmid) [Paraburkholderia caribensis MBA4]|uniref:Uncharacterized protein n=1 Tax=Paraburkholderia caribensis MBA4 TaxID=1323664 RepID=A0A0P0RR57_9BURK|nr:hypothetical protein K788_0001754 [Paraburkholderia caribensis MBA4]